MSRIKKVTVIRDMVIVEAKTDGELKTIKRHVQNYESLNEVEKENLWNEIAGIPKVVYAHVSIFKRIYHYLRKT